MSHLQEIKKEIISENCIISGFARDDSLKVTFSTTKKRDDNRIEEQ